MFCYRAVMRLGDLIWRRSEGLQLAYLLPDQSDGVPAEIEDWDKATKLVWEVRRKISLGFIRDEVG